jgi:hypothetical protein
MATRVRATRQCLCVLVAVTNIFHRWLKRERRLFITRFSYNALDGATASRPESFSQAISVPNSGDPRSLSALRYLASSYGVRVIQHR